MAHSEPKRRILDEGLDNTDDGSSSSESSEDTTGLFFNEIKEENIVRKEKGNVCDLCMTGIQDIYRVAFYLCFTCVKYFCVECFRGHDNSHCYVNVNSNQGERERTRDEFLDEMWNERNIVEKLETENVCVCDRVNVKHELDKKDECWIAGLCGADNRRWVVCDINNCCIKIFQCGSNVLLRYLRIGSQPCDVTEIQVKQNSTVPDSASSSSSDISGTNRTKPDKQCLLAVTLPWKRHILFININKNPAVTVKSIPMEKPCYAIEYSEDKIFTLCDKIPRLYDSRWSVYVMSTDGVKLSVIQTGIDRYIRTALAVLPGRVYLTDDRNHKVTCMNVEGRVLSEITVEVLRPYCISVDPDNNVYVSTMYPRNVYKLDMDLTGPPRLLLDPSTGYVEYPWPLCCYRDKLFVGHELSNIVSVVRLV